MSLRGREGALREARGPSLAAPSHGEGGLGQTT